MPDIEIISINLKEAAKATGIAPRADEPFGEEGASLFDDADDELVSLLVGGLEVPTC